MNGPLKIIVWVAIIGASVTIVTAVILAVVQGVRAYRESMECGDDSD